MEYIGVRCIIGDSVDTSNFVGAITEESEDMEANTDYVLQFKIINYGTDTVLNHIVYIKDGVSHLISQNLNVMDFPVVNVFTDEGITKQERLCHLVFRVPTAGKYRFAIARNQTSNDYAGKIVFDLREVGVEKGSILQEFRYGTRDYREFVKRCETYFEKNDKRIALLAKKDDINTTQAKIEVASDKILLEVKKKANSDDIVSLINLTPEEIKIKAEKIDMSGSLDLHGTFTCYANETNINNSSKLIQGGAMHRGYLPNHEYPTFSSGIWNPRGTDLGYVSVGYTNSDNFDPNGCLYMSPIENGGGELKFGKVIDTSAGTVVSSGLEFVKDGYINYQCFIGDKIGTEVYGHRFDSGISCYALNTQNIACTSWIRCDSTLFTEKDYLYLVAGGYNNQYNVWVSKDGHMCPTGNVQLGENNYPWYTLVCKYAPTITSDMRKKTDICYIDCPAISTFALRNEEPIVPVISRDDMYEFVRDDLRLATYKLIDSKEEDTDRTQIGFLAQDIMDTKVGKYIINDNDPDNLTYDMANRISVLEGALQKAIEKIELLEQAIINKEDAKK